MLMRLRLSFVLPGVQAACASLLPGGSRAYAGFSSTPLCSSTPEDGSATPDPVINGATPPTGADSGAARAPTGDFSYTPPKQRGDKPALSQKVKFVDRLVVEVAGGTGGGGSSALFGRSGACWAGSHARCTEHASLQHRRSTGTVVNVYAQETLIACCVPAAGHLPFCVNQMAPPPTAPQATTHAHLAATAAAAATFCSGPRTACWAWAARRCASPASLARTVASNGRCGRSITAALSASIARGFMHPGSTCC